MLPPDDAELDAMIEAAVRESDLDVFMFVVIAALHGERKLDARHLARGAGLMPEGVWIGATAFRMVGDVPEYLMDALRHKRLADDLAAQTVFIVAAWCQERRGGVLPEGLITLARLQARVPQMSFEAYALLLAVALQTHDEGLKQIMRARGDRVVKMPDGGIACPAGGQALSKEEWEFLQEQAREQGRVCLEIYHKPILQTVPDRPSGQLKAVLPLRRAVVRIGRNEPCPCGSGKKYKHCCVEKDHERLQHASPVAGRTQEELATEAEPHLTPMWIGRCAAHEVARFDPKKIVPGLLPAYFERLCRSNLFDRATEAFEQVGYAEALAANWDEVVASATLEGRRDLLRRLVDLRTHPAVVEAGLFLPAALLLADAEPAKLVKLLEAGTLKALTEDLHKQQEFAVGLLHTRFRALGILAARGVMPLLSRPEASVVFAHLLRARDRLNLPPDDPCADLLDRLFLDIRTEESKDAVALGEAQRKLGDKVKEVGQLKESLDRLQRDVVRRERAASAPLVPSVQPVLAAEDPALKELRGKVEVLKSALKERHNERNELRRELEKAHTDLEDLRRKAVPAVPSGTGQDTDDEEDLLLPQDTPDIHPVRIIEFPRHFQESLASLPRSVARGTLTMLGRLAAGEPAAFVGAVRLKVCPSIMRQRIGIDFRLLFRLLPERVQVVDLIPRQDLERKIKTLV